MSIRILLADDLAMVREGIRLLIEHQPEFSVVADTGDGADAVRQVVALRPDILVMDLSLPGLSGLEVARQVRAQAPGVKIVVLSMHLTEAIVQEALALGILGFVHKESAGQELMTAMRHAMRGERYFCHTVAAAPQSGSGNQPGGDVPLLRRLSRRERDILRMIAEGQTNQQMAEQLQLSPKTVETYRYRMMGKLDIHNQVNLMLFALRCGLGKM